MPIRKSNLLTARAVASAKDGWHADGGGLYLRVSDNGRRRRWIFRFTRSGKVTEIGLGAVAAVTLAGAREKRERLADQLQTGLNPLAERRRVKVAQEGRKTFKEVARTVIEREREGWGASSLRVWERSLYRDCKPLADLRVDEIGVDQVKAVVTPIWETGRHPTARRTLAHIETVLDAAIAHGWRSSASANPAAWSVFRHIMPKAPKGDDPHHPMTLWPDAPAAFAKLRASNANTARCVEFIALTGVRLGEAREARWPEIDFDKALWTVPRSRMKTRDGAHVVPLSRQALDLLTKLKAHRTGPLVFFGQKDRQPVSRMACWKRSLSATDDKGSVHGWRATFRSWCADNGVPREVAESALAHKIGGVEGAYNRAAMIERRRPVMQAWADHCDGLAAAKVILFGKRA